MKLFEFEAKQILKKYDIPVPRGQVATSMEQAEAAAKEIGGPVVVKAQVLVAGRGKAGGILFAGNATEAKGTAGKLLGSTIKGIPVRSLLVEQKLNIAGQYYLAITVDRQARKYVMLASQSGGVDIEEVAATNPEKIARYWIDPVDGFSTAKAEADLRSNFTSARDVKTFASLAATLFRILTDTDAELVEINPLILTSSGEMIAADAKIIIDENALFRHPEFQTDGQPRADETPREAEAKKQGLAYVDLDGDVGIVGNGAGLTMATIDVVYHFGGKPANFLDVGGGGSVDVTTKGLLFVLNKPGVKGVVVNVLGGITRCDVVAQAIIEALSKAPVKKPVAVRIMGTNEEQGNKLLQEAGIRSYPNMDIAIDEIIKTIGKQ